MRKISINIFFAAGVTILLLLSGCASGKINLQNTTLTNSSQQKTIDGNQEAEVTCYIGGVPYTQKISYTSGVQLKELFTELAIANARDPDTPETQQLQQQILLYAEQKGLLPKGISADKIFTSIGNIRQNIAQKQSQDSSPLDAGTSHQFFCNFVSTGEGSAFPIIILPRFIPIIMGPIPRLFVGWKTSLGVTSCGGLVSRTGFIASGPQQGIALGFWGIGFSIFLPPVMAYGMFGYALYAKVTAAQMDYWPPNNAPEITAIYPLDGAMYIPLSTTELSFHIGDLDGDLMSYSVTTDPDVGGGNGNLKPDGTYTVPISGLKSNTEYSWSVTASDGKDTVEKEFTFTTEPVAPIISQVQPVNGNRYVPITQTFLRFHLRDPQGDLMDYTVETSPFIGSGSASGVSEGDISIPISGLDYLTEYHWYVNATDGEHMTSESFWFRTGPIMVFDPFEEGWGYRKMITINHTQVVGDLHSFPVLLSVTDADLRDKAQNDGDDILFMSDTGVATRLYHEIEKFDGLTGELVGWVNITNLTPDQDTTFYMYYGNPSSSNQQTPEGVWDSNHIMVQHMKDNPDSSHIIDSTAYDNDGIKKGSNGPVEVSGKIGKAQNFDGNDDYISVDNSISLQSPDASVTVSSWVLVHGWYNGWAAVYAKSEDEIHGQYGLCFTQDGRFDVDAALAKITIYTDFTFLNDEWYSIAYTWDGNIIHIYVNGINIGSASNTVPPASNNDALEIGRHQPGATEYMDGALDEIRISNLSRSSNWISTSYNNQNNPLSFCTFGPEESPP